MGPKGRKRSGQPKSASLFLADIGLHDTHVLLGDKPGHSRNVPLNFYLGGAAAAQTAHNFRLWAVDVRMELSQENWVNTISMNGDRCQMSRGYIHSSSKSSGT
jgi:hypothetical protein